MTEKITKAYIAEDGTEFKEALQCERYEEVLKQFPVGAHVFVTQSVIVGIAGCSGRVVGHDFRGDDNVVISVKLDKPPMSVKLELHSCGGKCELGTGWNFTPNQLKVIDDNYDASLSESVPLMLPNLKATLQRTRAGRDIVGLNYHKDRTGEWVEIVEANSDGEVTRRDVNVEGNSAAATIIAIVKEVM